MQLKYYDNNCNCFLFHLLVIVRVNIEWLHLYIRLFVYDIIRRMNDDNLVM